MPIDRTPHDNELSLEQALELTREAYVRHHVPAFRRHVEVVGKPLAESFWIKLEHAGKVNIEAVGRSFIHGALANYSSSARLTWRDNRRKKQNRISALKHALKLADQLEADLDDFQLMVGDCSKHVLASLLRQFVQDNTSPPGTAGNADHDDDIALVRALAEAYHRAGGHVARSVDGSFGKFLQQVWTALPRARNCATAETFAALSKRISDSELKQTRSLPRGWPVD